MIQSFFFFLISRYWEWWFEHVHPYFQLTNLEYVLYENIEHKTYLESYDDIDFRRKDPFIIQVEVFISLLPYKISFLQKVNETMRKEILNPEKNLISFKHLND